jgi:hypothetical protein
MWMWNCQHFPPRTRYLELDPNGLIVVANRILNRLRYHLKIWAAYSLYKTGLTQLTKLFHSISCGTLNKNLVTTINVSQSNIFLSQIAIGSDHEKNDSRKTKLLTTWSSIVGEKNVSLQRERELWKPFAAKLYVTYQIVDWTGAYKKTNKGTITLYRKFNLNYLEGSNWFRN